ncbi:helix-turn-helix domain-containing protein [Aquibacillus sediminis]|uniref:helix-turn-helix domain-containing protein n=1 Tax=Aquibacillus sediminis TaxID=2574734 RepID=UPI0011091F9D|nr:helix-turn-helix domain-containing protein [Aquibacillus sediminis]
MYKDYNDLPIVLSVKDIQVILGIGRRQAYALVNSNKFKVIKINKRILIPKSSFVEWFEGKQ